MPFIDSSLIYGKPSTFITGFFEKYPFTTKQHLMHEDKSYFFNIAQRSGQKPAPFIPNLDNNVEVQFKKGTAFVHGVRAQSNLFIYHRILSGC